MVRKTRIEAAATREALLDAAEGVFRAKGVAHSTLADVAASAGLTRGAVYWHFRDKAELFEAMCERAAMPLETMLPCADPAGCPDPLATLREVAVVGLTRLACDARMQAVFDIVFHRCEFTADLAPVAQRQQVADEGCRDHVIGLLEQAVALRQLPADTDTSLAAELMKAFMVGVMHEWVQNPASHDLERTAPVLIDTLIAGLVARPPRKVPLQVASRLAAKTKAAARPVAKSKPAARRPRPAAHG